MHRRAMHVEYCFGTLEPTVEQCPTLIPVTQMGRRTVTNVSALMATDRFKRSLSSYHGGACVLHANGTVEVLDPTETEERVRQLLAQ